MRVYWLFLDTARTVFREAVDLVGVPYRAAFYMKNQILSSAVGHNFSRCFSGIFGISVPPMSCACGTATSSIAASSASHGGTNDTAARRNRASEANERGGVLSGSGALLPATPVRAPDAAHPGARGHSRDDNPR